jgi:viroplasmin and RNaseH domain-containing protein
MKSKKNQYYAYFVPSGTKVASGITADWKTCEKLVSGKTGARYKGFATRHEAESWLGQGAMYAVKPRPRLAPGLYFDAGTGRGDGVEISVTDERGVNLLHKAVPKSELNKYGKHVVRTGDGTSEATNNYGELLALRYALEIAGAIGIKKVFGDSKLVIDYWSQWKMKRKELPEETVALAEEVSSAREAFEANGGEVARISGDNNPADLGFH